MNLPHKAPLLFAKEILLKTDERVEVLCLFPVRPTLAMFIEAAAQSSAAFNTNEEAKVGFLTMATNISLLASLEHQKYIVSVVSESEVGPYKKFSFMALDFETKQQSVKGNFTLAIGL